jgi:ABC-2 type transport system ATP-binding protein
MTVVIEAEQLAKTFSVRRKAGRLRRTKLDVEAVRGVTLRVDEGELIGYLGPNGAGKSTTIKMMTGILAPTSGRIRVAGLDPLAQRTELARRIGVVFGQRSTLWWDLPLRDTFQLLRDIYRIDRSRHRENVAYFTSILDAEALLDVPVRQLSLGQRMRGELIAALLHDPSVLFLDEPTVGLDVVSKHAVREALARLNRERGVTVILTTHDLADVERLCERVVVIDHGLVQYDGSLIGLKQRYGNERVLVIELADSSATFAVDGLAEFRADGPRRWLRFDGDELSAADAIARVMNAVSINDLTIEEPDIDDVVRRMYTDEADRLRER